MTAMLHADFCLHATSKRTGLSWTFGAILLYTIHTWFEECVPVPCPCRHLSSFALLRTYRCRRIRAVTQTDTLTRRNLSKVRSSNATCGVRIAWLLVLKSNSTRAICCRLAIKSTKNLKQCPDVFDLPNTPRWMYDGSRQCGLLHRFTSRLRLIA